MVTDLARRRAVVVIGAGISRHSVSANGVKPPLWDGFLRDALDKCPDKTKLKPVKDALRSGDLLHACEWLKLRYDEQWTTHLRRTFSHPAFPPAPIHDAILKLDSRIVFSLNFDDIYERHANSIHNGSFIVKNYHDPDVSEFLRGTGNYIIKLHGSLNVPEKMIFTHRDYSNARVTNSSFYQAFDATLLTHTFIFLGCGITDPDINLLLENQNFGFPVHSPHYFVTGASFSADRVKSLRDNRNLKVVPYLKVDDNHSGLVAELNNLASLVDSERFELAKTAGW